MKQESAVFRIYFYLKNISSDTKSHLGCEGFYFLAFMHADN